MLRSGNDQWTPGVIAAARRLRLGQTSVVMLTEPDLTSLRQKHNVHLLDEILAIQPYVPRKPFSGCGLFETTFARKGKFRDAPTAFKTHELAQWSEEGPNPNPVPTTDESDTFQSSKSPGCRFERGRFDGKVSSAHARGRSSQRVHGVLHRVLAATTKDIVNHVERQVRRHYAALSLNARRSVKKIPIFVSTSERTYCRFSLYGSNPAMSFLPTSWSIKLCPLQPWSVCLRSNYFDII